MKKKHFISPDRVDFTVAKQILNHELELVLSDEAVCRINKCRSYLDNKLKGGKELLYGINTGFGSLCDVVISEKDLGKLQINLVKSHACGTGEELDVVFKSPVPFIW